MSTEELTPEEQEFEDLKEFVAVLEQYLMDTGGRNIVILEMLNEQKALLEEGYSRLPEAPEAVEISDDQWDENGFSLVVNEFGCVQFRPIYDAAVELEATGDRVKEYMAHFMRRNWYLLPVPNREDEFENNPEWSEFWNMAYDANTVFVFGRSKFFNKDLYTEYTRGKYNIPKSTGSVIPDHYVPWVGRNTDNWQKKLINRFIDRWTNSGKGLFHAYNVARKALHDMDDGRKAKWSGYKTFAESNYNGPLNPRTKRESSDVHDNPYAVILTPDSDPRRQR